MRLEAAGWEVHFIRPAFLTAHIACRARETLRTCRACFWRSSCSSNSSSSSRASLCRLAASSWHSSCSSYCRAPSRISLVSSSCPASCLGCTALRISMQNTSSFGQQLCSLQRPIVLNSCKICHAQKAGVARCLACMRRICSHIREV